MWINNQQIVAIFNWIFSSVSFQMTHFTHSGVISHALPQNALLGTCFLGKLEMLHLSKGHALGHQWKREKAQHQAGFEPTTSWSSGLAPTTETAAHFSRLGDDLVGVSDAIKGRGVRQRRDPTPEVVSRIHRVRWKEKILHRKTSTSSRGWWQLVKHNSLV